MPRRARVKSIDSTYHVMVRSISEINLFRDSADKDKFLSLLKKYQDVFLFKIYAYCLMDTHAHLLIYSNGADVSKIMHGVNQSYAQYYNWKYNRHGHVFQDRFKSKLVQDDNHLLSVSGYIHNNPGKIGRSIENYPYSTMGMYMGIRKDPFELLDASFIFGMIGGNIASARKQYREFIYLCTDEKELPEFEFQNEPSQYRREKTILIRNYKADDIICYIGEGLSLQKTGVSVKNNRKVTDYRALCVLFLRCLCDFRCRDISKALGNLTQSRISALCSRGYDLICRDDRYMGIFEKFIETHRTA